VIKLQFSSATDLGSRVIQFYERGWPSHVDAVRWDGMLLGARSDVHAGVPAGVQLRPPDYKKFNRVEIVKLPCSHGVESLFWDFLNTQIGKPYDKKAIVAFAVRRDWRNPDQWFCSELIVSGLEESGFFPRKLLIPANEVTPRDNLILVSPWRYTRSAA
jgi:uncharacterized protein YycO